MTLTELQPTRDNLIETFKNDPIGRSKSVALFAQYLAHIDSGFSIAVDNSWGGGKTFFVKQAKMILDAYSPFAPHSLSEEESVQIQKLVEHYLPSAPELLSAMPHVSVYYDAWANDNSSDPLLSLVYEILRCVNVEFDSLNKSDVLRLSTQIVDFFTGKNSTDILDTLRGKNPLDKVSSEKSLKELIDAFLNEIIIERGNRLVVFIDELDRCKPSYAVQLLERVKHYFSNEKVTFVFSINSDALQHTIRTYYGADYDSSRYLDRFFDLTMSIPPFNIDKFYAFLHLQSSGTIADEVRYYLVTKYKLSMREIIRYYKITSIATRRAVNMPLELQNSVMLLLPVAAILRLTDRKSYLDFVQGRDGAPFFEMMEEKEFFDLRGDLLSVKELSQLNNDPLSKLLPQKTKEMYSALFSREFNQQNGFSFTVGSMRFSLKTRIDFFSLLGALSEKADYT